jgi:chemotaxis response regulator CheB
MSARGYGVGGPVGVRVRVLVAGESRAMRSALRRMLAAHRRLEVVGLAADADEVIRAVARHAPDVIVLDVGMDATDALTTIGRVMAEHPTAVVAMSATTPEGGEAAIRALELGTVDVLAKPSWSVDPALGALAQELVRKVLAAARVRPTRIAAARTGRRRRIRACPPSPRRPGTRAGRLAWSSPRPPAVPPRSCPWSPSCRAICPPPCSWSSTCPRPTRRPSPACGASAR